MIVSTLTGPEAEEPGLVAEAEECVRNGLLFISVPIEDWSLPAHAAEFAKLVDQLVEYSRTRKSVAIHCRAGIGRSSLIAACILTKMGLSPGCIPPKNVADQLGEENEPLPIRSTL